MLASTGRTQPSTFAAVSSSMQFCSETTKPPAERYCAIIALALAHAVS